MLRHRLRLLVCWADGLSAGGLSGGDSWSIVAPTRKVMLIGTGVGTPLATLHLRRQRLAGSSILDETVARLAGDGLHQF
jgi:hypothetical protein